MLKCQCGDARPSSQAYVGTGAFARPAERSEALHHPTAAPPAIRVKRQEGGAGLQACVKADRTKGLQPLEVTPTI